MINKLNSTTISFSGFSKTHQEIIKSDNSKQMAEQEPELGKLLEKDSIEMSESSFVTAPMALKTQLLYQQKKSGYIEYLQAGLEKEEIIAKLKDKETMGRSFFGYKSRIANTILSSKNSDLTTKNFNILMNTKDKKLSTQDIVDILEITTRINNIPECYESKKYNFKGGNLSEEDIDNILNKIQKDRNEQILTQQMMLQQQMLQQQMMQQDIQQQQMMEQQIMMSTPGFGFC